MADFLTLLVAFRQQGWRGCNSLGLPSVWLPQFAGGDWMDQFDHEDELAYAITSGAVAHHCADANGLKPLPRGRLRRRGKRKKQRQRSGPLSGTTMPPSRCGRFLCGPLDFTFYYLMSNTPRASKKTKQAYDARNLSLIP